MKAIIIVLMSIVFVGCGDFTYHTKPTPMKCKKVDVEKYVTSHRKHRNTRHRYYSTHICTFCDGTVCWEKEMADVTW